MGTVRQLLDKGYDTVSTRVLVAISESTTDGIVKQRLSEVEAEAKRLADAGEKMTVDNAVLRAFFADYEDAQKRNAKVLDGQAPTIQTQGAGAAKTLSRQLALPGLSDNQLESVGIRWKAPDPEAVAALVNFSDGDAWANEIKRYPQLSVRAVQDMAIRGIVNGMSPLRVARMIRESAESVPAHYANTLMRTLQLQSYRTATATYHQANSDIISYVVRIATLDNRTCLSCIALHGTQLPVGARVNDHHNGRCTSVAVIKGRERTITTGLDWFDAQPEERKREIAGNANYEALSAGAVRLNDFVARYDDPVFGQMIGEASLVSILGSDATQYKR